MSKVFLNFRMIVAVLMVILIAAGICLYAEECENDNRDTELTTEEAINLCSELSLKMPMGEIPTECFNILLKENENTSKEKGR